MKKIVTIGIAILIGFSLATPVVSGNTTLIDETTTISAGGNKTHELRFNKTRYLQINVEVKDEEGLVNLHLLEEDEYENYEQGREFETIPEGSSTRVSSTTLTGFGLTEGNYYLVIENVDQDTNVELSLEVIILSEEDNSPGFTSTLLLMAGITAVAIYRKKKR